MKKLTAILSSVAFPHKCTFCRKTIDYTNNTFICTDCMNTIPFIKGAKCIRCGTPRQEGSMPVCYNCRKYRHPFTKAFTPLSYKDSVRHAIINMKFRDKDNFCRSFAFLIANNVIKEGFPKLDFVTYIPLSKESFNIRGFNQSELIAKECGRILNLPVIETLNRVDGTPRQSTLPMRERRKNVKKAFKSKSIPLSGSALLIDDVYTTGSTMSYTSSLLLKMGCDRVYIACVALREKN